MQIAVREDDEAAVLGRAYLRACSFADERVLVLGLGLEHDEREALLVEEEEVDEPFFRFSKFRRGRRGRCL